MAFGKSNSQGKGASTALLIKSIAACVATPSEKKKQPCVVVAYALKELGQEVFFLALPLPSKNKLLRAEDIFEAIRNAEGADNVSYLDDESRTLDILFCRAEEGKAFDVVERDSEKNCYTEGFAEVTSAKLRFRAEQFANSAWKYNEKMSFKFTAAKDESERDSYEYAVVNAYNACLLGKVFRREELYLETRDRKRVKLEVRNVTSKYLTEDVLYVHPVSRDADGYIDYYVTEEFNYNDGKTLSQRAYQIRYMERLGDFNVTRV